MIKKHKTLLAYMLVLTMFSVYVVLDTFVITRVYGEASDTGTEAAMQIEDNNAAEDSSSENPGQTENAAAESQESEHSHGPGSGGPGHSGKHRKQGGSSGGTSAGSSASGSSTGSSDSNSGSTEAVVSSGASVDSYTDDNISIKMSEYTVSDTTVHVAEVKVTDAKYLKTAFAQGAYGRNVTAATSDIAESVNAILAINGDYYGSQEKGYVIRNGVLYRSTAASNQEDLVIYTDGSFEIINESEVTAQQLMDKGAVQTLSFGPALVENGAVSVSAGEEVGRSMASNPRTAIGIKSDGTYLFVVSDGRTADNEGLSLLQLAEFMEQLGAATAYNLDGGGSSTMVFNGNIVNTPTGGGVGSGSGSERKVSDIVYIGY